MAAAGGRQVAALRQQHDQGGHSVREWQRAFLRQNVGRQPKTHEDVGVVPGAGDRGDRPHVRGSRCPNADSRNESRQPRRTGGRRQLRRRFQGKLQAYRVS